VLKLGSLDPEAANKPLVLNALLTELENAAEAAAKALVEVVGMPNADGEFKRLVEGTDPAEQAGGAAAAAAAATAAAAGGGGKAPPFRQPSESPGSWTGVASSTPLPTRRRASRKRRMAKSRTFQRAPRLHCQSPAEEPP
jgi:hypothetical protein